MRWEGPGLQLLEQTKLPVEEVWIDCETPEDVADAIYRLAVRGAPAIGVAAAYGLVLGLRTVRQPARLQERFDEVSHLLGSTRPTAVNLRWALDRGRKVFDANLSQGPEAVAAALLAWARELHADDVRINKRIGEHGAPLFAKGSRVLTHCNTGALATAGYGTALGVIQSAWRDGHLQKVWVDETRPLLQGARLTAWELKKLGIPFHLVTDSSAGTLMAQGLVDGIVVGADRIAANGDAANKIGTYTRGRPRPSPPDPLLRRRPALDDRPRHAHRRRHPDREAQGDRGHRGLRHPHRPRRDRSDELRLRRHARGADHGDHHGSRSPAGALRGEHRGRVQQRQTGIGFLS